MRLGEIAELLRTVEDKLNIIIKGETVNAESFYRIHNLESVREGLTILGQTGLFQEQLSNIYHLDILQTFGDNLRINMELGNNFSQQLSLLKIVTKQLLMALVELTGHTESPNSIYIKFPAVNDFDGIEKNAARFQQILTQVILDQEIGGSIKIVSVENGSIWFKVIVGTQLAVQLIGALCNSAALLMRESKQDQYIEQYIKEKKIENEEKENLLKLQKGLVDFYLENEAKNIEAEHFKNSDANNERTGRLMKAIRELSALIKEGAEIQPSLLTPPEIKNVFPDMKNLPGLESKTKILENLKPTDE